MNREGRTEKEEKLFQCIEQLEFILESVFQALTNHKVKEAEIGVALAREVLQKVTVQLEELLSED